MTDGLLISVDLSYATYGIIVSADVVVDAPPIARWLVGKPWPEVQHWLVKRRAKVVPLPRAGSKRVKPRTYR